MASSRAAASRAAVSSHTRHWAPASTSHSATTYPRLRLKYKITDNATPPCSLTSLPDHIMASSNAHDQSRLDAWLLVVVLLLLLLLLLLLGTHITMQVGNPITPDDQPCGYKGCYDERLCGKDCGCSTFARENPPLAGLPALRKPHYT